MAVVVQVEAPRARSGRRYRVIEDPDRLLEELKHEEKAVEKAKAKLKILVKKQVRKEGIYKDFEPQIQAVERSIDNRLDRIAEIQMLIAEGFAQKEIDDDDEEVLLLS